MPLSGPQRLTSMIHCQSSRLAAAIFLLIETPALFISRCTAPYSA